MLTDIKFGISNYIQDTKNPLINFMMGATYEAEGQLASAVSFYVRTTGYSKDPLLTYEALLRIALCFEAQGCRWYLVKGTLHRAISVMPDRPEAYFLLARTYRNCKEYTEGYAWAVLGESKFSKEESYKGLHTDVQYSGNLAFTYERAISGWWIGLQEESMYLLKQLFNKPNVPGWMMESVKRNLRELWTTWKHPIAYDSTMWEKLRYKFEGSKGIKQNYSQCYQDMFVLTMLNGKKNGSFIEIGHGDPFFGNNTYLLESQLGWTGVSVDYSQALSEKFRANRKSTEICQDATTIDYSALLNDKVYDYLQIDCDPPVISLNVLKRIPFDRVKFRVITFEHDFYNGDNSLVREDSRKYLESFGYKRIVGNIAADDFYAFEDWYVHPDLVDANIIEKMFTTSDDTKRADNYMLM